MPGVHSSPGGGSNLDRQPYDGLIKEVSIRARNIRSVPSRQTIVLAAATLLIIALAVPVHAQPVPTCNGLPATIVGTSGNDNLVGTDGDDVIVGLEGDDFIDGLKGNDTICGGAGRDDIYARSGADWISAGPDSDRVYGGAGRDYMELGAGWNRADGQAGNDRIFGGPENDRLTGGTGDDIIDGGDGDDFLDGRGGHDRLRGRAGNDRIEPGGGDDIVRGGTGRDEVNYESRTESLTIDLGAETASGAGTDSLLSIENATGGYGDDVITGNERVNTLSGGRAGDDTLRGLGNADHLFPDDGNDIVDGGDGSDWVEYGGVYSQLEIDLATGTTTGSNISHTLTSIENVVGGGNDDIIRGDAGPNKLTGERGDDVIEGKGGDDLLRGKEDRDILDGGAGDDDLRGNSGRDTLDGGTGTNVLDGGLGEDTCTNGATVNCELPL